MDSQGWRRPMPSQINIHLGMQTIIGGAKLLLGRGGNASYALSDPERHGWDAAVSKVSKSAGLS